MKKYLCLILCLLFVGKGFSQEKERPDFTLNLGLVYNKSNLESNTMTGMGIFFEPKFFWNNRFVVGYRFEPMALAYGVGVFPGGCTEEHPLYPGMPSCREGANYVLNNYLFSDYRLGSPKYGPKGGLRQFYTGLSLNLYTHNRYIITSRQPGNYQDTQRWVTNIGPGVRFGAYLGRVQVNLSYNLTGDDFQPFLGTSIGYQVIR